MPGIVLAYVTAPSAAEASRIARHLLERHLIGCANVLPMTSIYRWEGAIAEEGEVAMILKTRSELFDALREEVARIHPYKVPCILRIPADANAAYFAWISAETVGLGRAPSGDTSSIPE